MAVVLVTRPAAAAERTLQRLRELGHEPLLAPVAVVEPLPQPRPDLTDVQAMVVTSRQAVPAVAAWRPDRPLYAVGAGTADALTTAGLPLAAAGTGDGSALGGLLASRLDPKDGAILHPTGEAPAAGLRRALEAAGFAYRPLAVYRARPVAALPDAVRAALAAGRVHAVTLHSPESARRFTALVTDAGLADRAAGLVALCLSANVADAALALEWKAVRIADRPDEDGMGRLLEAALLWC